VQLGLATIRGERGELHRQRPRQQQRHQHAKQIGVPRLRQTEVQQAEQHEDAERRQAHAAPQRQAHSRQHDHLVSAELAEILRPPFDDER